MTRPFDGRAPTHGNGAMVAFLAPNRAAVDAAYALSGGKKTWKNDAERVAFLFDLYQRITSLLPTDKPKRKRRMASQQ